MTDSTRIAIIGAGVIGRRHVGWLRRQPGCEVIGVADPSPAARDFCAAEGLDWFAEYRPLLDRRPDGVIIATPNGMHLPMGLECLARGLPTLMEKPVADTVASAIAFTQAALDSRVPVLVGHHRRHNPAVLEARRIIAAGELGRLVAIDIRMMFLKPDDYFAPAWRTQPGAGPVLINLVHDIDAVRFMAGEISSVQATMSNATRGFAVEDTAAVIMTLENGAIATATLSDAIPSPYGWETNAAEDPSFPEYGKDTYLIGGTHASLALPSLRLWSYGIERGWMAPLHERQEPTPPGNPYVRQCAHFLRMVRGEEAPAVTPADSTRSQIVAAAVAEAAHTGQRIDLKDRLDAVPRASKL